MEYHSKHHIRKITMKTAKRNNPNDIQNEEKTESKLDSRMLNLTTVSIRRWSTHLLFIMTQMQWLPVVAWTIQLLHAITTQCHESSAMENRITESVETNQATLRKPSTNDLRYLISIVSRITRIFIHTTAKPVIIGVFWGVGGLRPSMFHHKRQSTNLLPTGNTKNFVLCKIPKK